jgi:Ca-activated chloride channel family protein
MSKQLRRTVTVCAVLTCAAAGLFARATSARWAALRQADGQWHPFSKPNGDTSTPVNAPDSGTTPAQAAPAAPSLTTSPSPSSSAPPNARRNAIRVETNLVNILTSVIDDKGKPVADLPETAFSLSEEGVPQKIERFEAQTNRPVDLALMVDASASTFKDLKFETDAAGHFIKQVIRPGDSLSVFEVAEAVTQIGEFTDNVSRLQSDVGRVKEGSGTSIYDALVLGSSALRRRPEGRRRAIILVTDAGETTSGADFEQARRAAIAADELIYTIVIRPVKNENGRNTAGEHALITITDSTGGNMFILDDLGQIGSMFDEIDRELRTQYLLGYYPQPSPPPGSDRHVEVKVAGNADYTLSYRKEYFAAK